MSQLCPDKVTLTNTLIGTLTVEIEMLPETLVALAELTKLFQSFTCQPLAADAPPPDVRPLAVGIGERVRQRRRYLNLTQAELADKAGLDMVNISRMENSNRDRMLRPKTLHAIAEALRCDLNWLLTGAGVPDIIATPEASA